jgi:dTDP-4-amino-4,6-dideoxygalactose transaminase
MDCWLPIGKICGGDSETLTFSWEDNYTYDIIELGYNYCIDETRSALAPVQFKRLTSTDARRMKISK